MAQRFLTTQTDFSGGQIDEDAKRRDDNKAAKTGARLMSNWRQRNVGTLGVRPGRNAIALTSGPRDERFRMNPAQELIIIFSNGALAITDTAGNVIASNSSAAYLWTNATVSQINWCAAPDRLVFCFPGMQPQVALYDAGSGTWSFAAFTFQFIDTASQEPFYRRTALGATMTPSAQTGSITLTCSRPYFTNAMIGNILSILGCQVTITAVGSVTPITTATVLVTNILPDWVAMSFAASSPNIFFPNQLAQGVVSKNIYEVGTISNTGATYHPGFWNGVYWVNGWWTGGTGISGLIATMVSAVHIAASTANEAIVTPYGALTTTGIAVSATAQPTINWQEEVMSPYTGWPMACFFDKERLGFCDFPLLPEAVLWSSTGIYDNFWVDASATMSNPAAGALPNSAILEFISNKPHVRNVAGWNGDEFVFTDSGIYSIPLVSTAGGLQGGTVSFNFISDASCSALKPAVTRDALLFTSASNDRVSAIIRTGNYTTPYVEQDLTLYHSQLLNRPIAIAVGKGDDGFPERYVYILNSDGSVVVGRMQEDRSFIGWMPWTGAGLVSWVSQGYLGVLFTTLYGTQYVLEFENPGYYLDQTVLVNRPPAKMLSGGNGAFIAFANGTVRVMDGAIDYGTRSVDATGHLIKLPGDNFSSATLVAGQAFTSTLSPFVPEAPPGQAMGQRQRLRRISRAAVQVYNSNGFTFGGRTIPPNNFGEDPTAQPVLRETTYRTRLLGRSFDPQIVLLKDNPGPLTVVEFTIESTV